MRRHRPPDSTPSWSTWPQALALFLRGRTLRVAGPVAALVGSVLTAVNQGGTLTGGTVSWSTCARVAVNYATPFTVASIGYLGGCRARPAAGAEHPDPSDEPG